jgi:hypothetical protein
MNEINKRIKMILLLTVTYLKKIKLTYKNTITKENSLMDINMVSEDSTNHLDHIFTVTGNIINQVYVV